MHSTFAPTPTPALAPAARHPDQWFAASDERGAARAAPAMPTNIIGSPCAHRPAAGPAVVVSRRNASRGFTLIETMVALAVTGVLSSVALPSFEGQVQKARRADVLVSMMQVQMAEERWRSNNASYGSLAEVGAPAASASGYYALQVTAADADGFVVMANAVGVQSRDLNCRHLQFSVVGSNVTQASGPDANVANPTEPNRKCWNL